MKTANWIAVLATAIALFTGGKAEAQQTRMYRVESVAGGIPQYHVDPIRRDCVIVDGVHAVCSRTEILEDADQAARQHVHEARQSDRWEYRVSQAAQRALRELDALWRQPDMTPVRAAEGIEPYLQRVTQEMQGMDETSVHLVCTVSNETLPLVSDDPAAATCIPRINLGTDPHGTDVRRALERVRSILNREMSNTVCAAACDDGADRAFCMEHELGSMAVYNWNRNYTPDGAAQRCTPDTRDDNCRYRQIMMLSRDSCSSAVTFVRRNLRRVVAINDRHETYTSPTTLDRRTREGQVFVATLRSAGNRVKGLADQALARRGRLGLAAIAAFIGGPDAAVAALATPASSTSAPTEPPTTGTDVVPDDPEGTTAVARTETSGRGRSMRARAATADRDDDQIVTGRGFAADNGGGRGRPARHGGSRRASRHTSTPTGPAAVVTSNTTTSADAATTLASMGCEPSAQRRDGTYVMRCRVNGSLEPVFRAENLHRRTNLTPVVGERDLVRRLRPVRPQIRSILNDNPARTRSCSPIMFACRANDWTKARPHYFVRRFGVCEHVNGNSNPMTVDSFLEAAANECRESASDTSIRVRVWGANNARIRLRFRGTPPGTTASN